VRVQHVFVIYQFGLPTVVFSGAEVGGVPDGLGIALDRRVVVSEHLQYVAAAAYAPANPCVADPEEAVPCRVHLEGSGVAQRDDMSGFHCGMETYVQVAQPGIDPSCAYVGY
jgi:hypothetical protein